MLHSTFTLSLLAGAAFAALSDSSLEKHVGSLSLSASFNPIKESYWTGYPHHRRTPFAVSPDGKLAYLAYLDASETDVHVQQVDPSTFAAVGTATTVSGAKEAGGLVAHNDGFAVLVNEAMPSGTSNAPADSTPVPVLYRYTSGKQTFKTWLGGPDVHPDAMLNASPDMNGDLAFSEATGMYGAYFVVTAYTTDYAGHFGDSIQYVTENGTIEQITGASSSFGCSHNTGIAFEAADSVPFASICAEDQGAIWLNTKTQYMDGVKISNENVTNGASNEPTGGMSGSYSGLARYVDSDSYIFTWVSRGAKDLTTNDWLGAPYTHSVNRTNNRNVAIARFSDKNTLIGDEATATLGADGDSQVNWITTGTADCSNAHVAAFDGTNALVTWEEIAQPQCDFIAMGCKGAYTGSYFQLVKEGEKVGEPVKATDVFVAGDMVTMTDGRVCWPYVDMDWKLDGPVSNAASVKEISFACMSLDGSGSSTPASSSAAAASSTRAASSAAKSSAQAQPSSIKEVDVSSSAAAAPETSAAIPQVSSAAASAPISAPAADETALPTFEIVSSGASVTPPASSAPLVSSAPAVSSASVQTQTFSSDPFDPSDAPAFTSNLLVTASSTPCSSSVGSVITEVPEVPSSAALPTEVPSEIPSAVPELPSSAALPTEVPSGVPEAPASSKTTCSGTPSVPTNTDLTTEPTEVPALPEGSDVPSFPFPSGSNIPSFPFPTGIFPSGHGHHGHHGHHSRNPFGGSWPTGFPQPSGWGVWPTGFGPRPTGGFGGQRPSGLGFGSGAGKTPCGFQTKVRPTATPSV